MPRQGNKDKSPSESKSVILVLGFSLQILNYLLRSHPPRQLLTWGYHRQNRTIKLDFMRRSQQVLECFWKSDQKSSLIAGSGLVTSMVHLEGPHRSVYATCA